MKSNTSKLFILFLLLIPQVLFAQVKKGQIQGYIKDFDTGEVLPFATALIDGTTNGGISDDKGFYRIASIEPGRVNLKFSYIGYKDTTVSVDVLENKTIIVDIILHSGEELGEVVITGQAMGQVKAINTQLTSKTIKNVVSEQKIRELPDANAAEALARLPGVSVLRQGGEAVAVRVRGVDANTMYVNGMRMDGGLGSVSSSMIGSIELSKAFLPDQDADILGGAIDFKLREAPSGFKKDIWVRTGYNGFTKSFKMQDISVLLSDRFFNDRLGLMLSFSYDRKDRGKDIVSADYQSVGSSVNSEILLPDQLTNVSLMHSENLNNRYGLSLYSDYKLRSGKLFYQGFISSLRSENAYATNVYSNIASITYESREYTRNEGNSLHGIGGEHTILGAKLDWGVSYSKRKYETPNSLYYSAGNSGGMGDNVNSIDTLTTINQFIELGTHDITKTYANSVYNSNEEFYSNETGYKLNIEIPYNIGKNIDGYIKLGGKIRDINRGYDHNETDGVFRNDSQNPLSKDAVERLPDYGWTYVDRGWLGHEAFSSSASNQGSDYSILGAKTYFYPDFDKVQEVTTAVIDKLYPTLYADVNDYTNTEKYYASYIMGSINIGKFLTFTPGVRYEKLTHETSAKWFEESIRYGNLPSQGQMKDTTNGSGNENFFPMMHLQIKPTKWFDIRLAYTETVSRPGYEKMSPRYYRDPGFNISKGDVFLKPQSNKNYDVYLSFYKEKIGLFTAGAFYKEMDDQVLDYSVTILEPKDYGLPSGYKNKTYAFPINNPWTGYIKGLEFDLQTHLTYLPKPLNGFIISGNLTYMESETKYAFYSWSKVKLDPFVFPFYKTIGTQTYRANKIIGMPDFIANVALGYEAGGFSGRISSYYQSATITRAQASDLSTDVDRASLTRFDVQLSQKIKKVKGLTLYLNINNLTNNPDQTVLTYYPDRVVSDERYGTSGDIGVRYRF